MSYVYKLLKLRLYKYHEDNKLFKNTYSLPSNIYKNFDKIKINRIDETINVIEENIKNDHKTIKSYRNIVKYIHNYCNNFLDCIDVIFDEFEKYKDGITDNTYLLTIGFTENMLQYNVASLRCRYSDFITNVFDSKSLFSVFIYIT